MKKTFYWSILMLIVVGFSSCNNNDEIAPEQVPDPQISMERYESEVINSLDLITDFYIEAKNNESTTRSVADSQAFLNLKNSLLPTAQQFATELGLSKKDLEDIFGSQIVNEGDQEDALVGILLFAVVTDCSKLNIEGTRGGSFGECFLEATGIAAGVAIVGNLAKGVMSKAMLSSVIKLAAKAGGRTLSGIGLGLIAAEMAICMW